MLEKEGSDFDTLDLESSSSEFSTDSDLRPYSSSDSDNDIALPTDWIASGRERNLFTFHLDNGVKVTVEDEENQVEYFEKYFHEEVIAYLVTKTNRFATRFQYENEENLLPQSRVCKWYDTSANDMKVFIALLILQGIDSNVENSMCFSSRESVASPLFCKIMSGCRFELVHKFLHFIDNDTITDHLGRKVAEKKPFIDLILKKFMKNYIAIQKISIDESLLAWKENLSWVQYIPAKCKRFGIKFLTLLKLNRICWNFW